MTWLILTHPDFELFILIFTNLQVYVYQFGYQNMLYVLVRTGNSFDTIKKICYFDCLRILSPSQSLSYPWIKQQSEFFRHHSGQTDLHLHLNAYVARLTVHWSNVFDPSLGAELYISSTSFFRHDLWIFFCTSRTEKNT